MYLRFLLSVLTGALIGVSAGWGQDAPPTPTPLPAFTLVPGKVLNPTSGERCDLSCDEELFTVDIDRGERPVSTIYRQSLANTHREVSLKYQGIIVWLRVSATGRYLVFGTEGREVVLAAPFGGDGDWRTWKLSASPWSDACFSLAEDYLMGCPENHSYFEGISLVTPPTENAPEVKPIMLDPSQPLGKEPALVALPDHRFLVDAAGLLLREDGTVEKTAALGSDGMYDFLVGPTSRGWVIQARQEYSPEGPYSIMRVHDVQLTAHTLEGQDLPLGWDHKKRINSIWIGKDDTFWMSLYDDDNRSVPWLHQYRIEPVGKPIPRKKRR